MKTQESHTKPDYSQFEVIKTSPSQYTANVQSGEFVTRQNTSPDTNKKDGVSIGVKEANETVFSGSSGKPNPFTAAKQRASNASPYDRNSPSAISAGKGSNHIAQFTMNKENQIQQIRLMNERINQYQQNIGMLKVQGIANQIAPRTSPPSKQESAPTTDEARKKELKVKLGHIRASIAEGDNEQSMALTNNVSLVLGGQVENKEETEEFEQFKSSNEIVQQLSEGIPGKNVHQNETSQSNFECEGLSPVTLPDPGHLKFLYDTRDSPIPIQKLDQSHKRQIKIQENKTPPKIIERMHMGMGAEIINPFNLEQNKMTEYFGFQMGLIKELQTNLNAQLQLQNTQQPLSAALDHLNKENDNKKPSNIPKPTSGITDPLLVKKMKIAQELGKITQLQTRNIQNRSRLSKSQGQVGKSGQQVLAKKQVQKLHEQAIVNNIMHNINVIQNEVKKKRDSSQQYSPVTLSPQSVHQGKQHSPSRNQGPAKMQSYGQSISIGGDHVSSQATRNVDVHNKRMSDQIQQSSIITKGSLDDMQHSNMDYQVDQTPKGWSQRKGRLTFENKNNSLASMNAHMSESQNPMPGEAQDDKKDDGSDMIEVKDQGQSVSPSQMASGSKTLQMSSVGNTQIKNILRSSFVDTVKSVDLKGSQQIYGMANALQADLNLMATGVNSQEQSMKNQPHLASKAIPSHTEPTDYKANDTIEDTTNIANVVNITSDFDQHPHNQPHPPQRLMSPTEMINHQEFKPDLMNQAAANAHKPQTAGNTGYRKKNLQAGCFAQQNNMINLQQMIKSQKPWGLEGPGEIQTALSGVEGIGPGSHTQGIHRGSFPRMHQRSQLGNRGFKTPNNPQVGQFFNSKNTSQGGRRRNISTQQYNSGTKPGERKPTGKRNGGTTTSLGGDNKVDFGNSMMSSNTGATGNTGMITSMMDNAQNAQLSKIEAAYQEPVFSQRFMNSFGFIDQLAEKDLRRKMYSRDGSIVDDNKQIPFCLREQKKDRVVRTNRSHNLRAKNNQTQLNTNQQPLSCNYIHYRFRMNEKQYQKCMGRRMTYMESEWIKEKRLKNIIKLSQEMQQQNDIILVADAINGNGAAQQLKTQQSNKDMPLFQMGEIPTMQALKVDIKATEIDAQQCHQFSNVQSKNEIVIGRVYSNQNSFNESSVDRDTANLSPMANVDPLQKVNQAKVVSVQRKKDMVTGMQNVLSSSTEENNDCKYTPQSQQKSRGTGQNQSKSFFSNGFDRASGMGFPQKRRGTEHNQNPQRPSAAHSQEKHHSNLKPDDTQVSAKLSDMDPLKLQELDTSLYNFNANQHRIFEDFLAQTQRSVIYEPIQSKIQKMSYNALEITNGQSNKYQNTHKTPTEIQQILNAHRAKMASRQFEKQQQFFNAQHSMMSKQRGVTKMDLQSGSVCSNSVNDKLSKNTSIAGDFTKIKMHKIMQSNFSQRQTSDKRKPLWNVNKNPKSKVINYKTQHGQQLSKLSTGDPYKKLNQLVQECIQSFGGAPNVRQRCEQTKKKTTDTEKVKKDKLNIEIDSDILKSQVEIDANPGDTRAIYAMKELKVAANPRYMLNSTKEGQKRASTNVAQSPKEKNSNMSGSPPFDFDDLNLHHIVKDDNDRQSRNGTIHSSMGKVSPSIAGANNGDRVSSVMIFQKPTIPTASAVQEGELSLNMNKSSERNNAQPTHMNTNNTKVSNFKDVLQDIIQTDKSGSATNDLNFSGRDNSKTTEPQFKSSARYVKQSQDKNQKYAELKVNKQNTLPHEKNIKLPMGNSIIAKSIQNSGRSKVLRDKPIMIDTPQGGTLRPLSTEEVKQRDDLNKSLKFQNAQLYNQQMVNNSQWQSFGPEAHQVVNAAITSKSQEQMDRNIQARQSVSKNEQIIIKKGGPQGKQMNDESGTNGVTGINLTKIKSDQNTSVLSENQMVTIPQIPDDDQQSKNIDPDQKGLLSGNIQPNLTLTPHSGFGTQQSNSPRSKGSSKIVFQRNRSPINRMQLQMRVNDNGKKFSNDIHILKNDQKSDDYIPQSPDIQFQVIKEVEPITTERPVEKHADCSQDTKSKDVMNRSVNDMQLLNDVYGNKDNSTYDQNSRRNNPQQCTTSRINDIRQSIEGYSQIDIQINKNQKVDTQHDVVSGNTTQKIGDVTPGIKIGEHCDQTNLASRDDLNPTYRMKRHTKPTVMVTAKNSSALGEQRKSSALSNLKKSHDSQEIKDIKYYISPKSSAFKEMQMINRNAFNIQKMQPEKKKYAKSPLNNATTNTRAYNLTGMGDTPNFDGAQSVTIHQSISTTNARGGRQSECLVNTELNRSPVINSRNLNVTSVVKNTKKSFDNGEAILKPQPIQQVQNATFVAHQEVTVDDTKTHQTMPLSPTSNATATKDKEDMFQQTSFIDKMSRDLTTRSPLGGSPHVLVKDKSYHLFEQLQNEHLDQIARKIVIETAKQPIHANPPNYLQKENIGTKYKFQLPKGGRRNREKFSYNSQTGPQCPTTHYGKSVISSTYRSQSDDDSDFPLKLVNKGGLKPLGIVKETIADTSKQVSILASTKRNSNITERNELHLPTKKWGVYKKAKEFYEQQVENVKCHRAKKFVEIQVDPQYRLDQKDCTNSVIHVVDAFGDQQSTIKHSENGSIQMSSQKRRREKQSTGTGLQDQLRFSMTQQTATNQMSQSSRNGDDFRSNDTRYVKDAREELEQLQNNQGYFRGISFTEDIKNQLVQECMINNQNYQQMQWKGLTAKDSQVDVKVKPHKKGERQSRNENLVYKTDFKKGVVKNLAGLIGKGVTEVANEHLGSINQPKNVERTVSRLWESRLQNKQAQAIADHCELEQRCQAQGKNNKVVVLVSSPAKQPASGSPQQPSPSGQSKSATNKHFEKNIFSNSFNVSQLLNQDEYKSHLKLKQISQANDSAKMIASDDYTPQQYQSIIKLTEAAGDKITLDSEAIRELMVNHEYQENTQNFTNDDESSKKQILQTVSFDKSPVKMTQTPRKETSSMMTSKNNDQKLGERDLWVLPTSEVEDLYKELKEKDNANQRNFGIVGRQPVLYEAKEGKKKAHQEKQRTTFAQINEQTKKAKCDRLIKLENQNNIFKPQGSTLKNLSLSKAHESQNSQPTSLKEPNRLIDSVLMNDDYATRTRSQAHETHQSDASKKEDAGVSPKSDGADKKEGRVHSQISIRPSIRDKAQNKDIIDTINSTIKP